MPWQQEQKGGGRVERNGRIHRTKELDIGEKGKGGFRMILSSESKLDPGNWTKKGGLETTLDWWR